MPVPSIRDYQSGLETALSEAYDYIQTDQPREFPRLDGACHENAIGVAQYLRVETPFVPFVTWGIVESEFELGADATVTDIEKDWGVAIHHWVEVPHPIEKLNTWFSLDAYTMPTVGGENLATGEQLVMNGRPKAYQLPSNGRFLAEGWISSSNLISTGAWELHRDRFQIVNPREPLKNCSPLVESYLSEAREADYSKWVQAPSMKMTSR